jgi:hypothetical protein
MKRSFKMHVAEDGKPYYPILRNHYEQCCSCGLTHRVNFEILDAKDQPIKGAHVRLTVWRNERLTTKARKNLKIDFRS